ncbi:P-loop containing nucleoside triphosphate hydrolase protein [Catenaria anguillulae PL171]|uniref:RNA helicase n=1 Tax=Catenaria anguillulae PL171 TaxID=765915 RepID=A0A1Y2H8T3_9FUNG|nr:P-loop containing nucleoside triphosphate hydrolase protein [Catenaria anguillulae PL171]
MTKPATIQTTTHPESAMTSFEALNLPLAIGVLQGIKESIRQPQALILVPTRQVAGNTFQILQSLSAFMDGVVCCVCTGDGSIREDVRTLSDGPQIVVGTPGRIAHLVHAAHLNVGQVKVLVVDKVQEMCALGFGDQTQVVITSLRQPQVVLFALNQHDDMVAEWELRMMHESVVRVAVNDQTAAVPEAVGHYYVPIDNNIELKAATLYDIFRQADIAHVAVFCKERDTADMVAATIRNAGITAAVAHGDAAGRARLVEEFRLGVVRVLVAAGSLPLPNVFEFKHVFNFDVPASIDAYEKRAIRAGRFGRKAVVATLAAEAEMDVVGQIAASLGVKMQKLPRDFAKLLLY